MDPNETLRRAQRAAAALLLQLDKDFDIDEEDVRALAEAFNDLNAWIIRGGALPEAWT
jgi:hypothetical protein